jgi:hypothetical protein
MSTLRQGLNHATSDTGKHETLFPRLCLPSIQDLCVLCDAGKLQRPEIQRSLQSMPEFPDARDTSVNRAMLMLFPVSPYPHKWG